MNDFTSPAVQAMNLIRYIGDEVAKTGKPIGQLPDVSAQIGAPSDQFSYELLEELGGSDRAWAWFPLSERQPNVSRLAAVRVGAAR